MHVHVIREILARLYDIYCDLGLDDTSITSLVERPWECTYSFSGDDDFHWDENRKK